MSFHLNRLNSSGAFSLQGPFLLGEISFLTTTIPNQICVEGAVMFPKENISFFLQVVGFHFKKKKTSPDKKKMVRANRFRFGQPR
jgi:hypothetical protein